MVTLGGEVVVLNEVVSDVVAIADLSYRAFVPGNVEGFNAITDFVGGRLGGGENAGKQEDGEKAGHQSD